MIIINNSWINKSAYRKDHSHETFSVDFVSNLLWPMERMEEVSIVIAIDLSAALDTVNYLILLQVLKDRFGVDDVVLNRFISYLLPKFCQVNTREKYSKIWELVCYVPQGICKELCLFSTYSGTLKDVIFNLTLERNTQRYGN